MLSHLSNQTKWAIYYLVSFTSDPISFQKLRQIAYHALYLLLQLELLQRRKIGHLFSQLFIMILLTRFRSTFKGCSILHLHRCQVCLLLLCLEYFSPSMNRKYIFPLFLLKLSELCFLLRCFSLLHTITQRSTEFRSNILYMTLDFFSWHDNCPLQTCALINCHFSWLVKHTLGLTPSCYCF